MNLSQGKAVRWRKRAEECRTLAEIVRTRAVEKSYLELAWTYENLADETEPQRPPTQLELPLK